MAVALQRARSTTLADMQLVEPRKEGPVPNHLLETSECLAAYICLDMTCNYYT